MKNRTLLFTASLVLLLGLVGTACTTTTQITAPPAEPVAQVETTSVMTASKSIELTALDPQNGETALDLLKSSGAEIEVKSFGEMGSFINSINGVAGDTENYWSFYVNGEYAQQAADKTILKPGDKVKFVFEQVSTAPAM